MTDDIGYFGAMAKLYSFDKKEHHTKERRRRVKTRRTRERRAPTEARYGDDKTIHHTGHVDVEVAHGHCVAVWFRCMALPFRSTVVTFPRDEEMQRMYANNKMPRIKAIITE